MIGSVSPCCDPRYSEQLSVSYPESKKSKDFNSVCGGSRGILLQGNVKMAILRRMEAMLVWSDIERNAS